MMTVQWQWTMDPQQADAVCTCTRCGGEIYGSDSDLCDACEEEAHSLDTIVKYAEAWPRRLFQFLWSEKDEEYMKPILLAFREYCEGAEDGCPDFFGWARS